MATFGDLIEEVLSLLHGHTTDVPAAATLAGAVTADSRELALDFGTVPWAGRPNGLVEVDDELIFVSAYNPTSGAATVPPWGRGQRGTAKAPHDADAMVTVRPRYPRAHVKRALNSVVRESCPPLYAALDLDFDTGALPDIGYPLPDSTIRVLRVEATDSLMSETFASRRVLRDWTVRNIAGTQSLEIPRDESFQTIRATVATVPSAMVADADDFATTTGLPESCTSLAVFGTVARLILGAELAKQQVTSIEASARNDKVQSGSATTVSRYYQALYTQRLELERDRLQQMYPIQLLRRG